MKVLIGELLNSVSRPNVALTMAPVADSKFPSKNIGDGFLEKYTKWKDLTANPRITADLNLIRNGGAELGMVGWKVTAGSVTATTAQHNTGAKSFLLTLGESPPRESVAYQDVSIRSGEYLGASVATMGDGTNGSGALVLQDLTTGRYLALVGGAYVWQDAIYYIGEQNAASWLTTTFQFQAEPFSLTLQHLTKIRIMPQSVGSSSGNAYVDDIVLYPATDFCGVFGFNFPARMSPIVYSSDTGAFGGEETTRFTMIAAQPAFYSSATTRWYARYVRMVLPGTPVDKPWIAEWIVGQGVDLARSGRYGSGWQADWSAVKKATARRTRLKKTERPARTLHLSFTYADETEWNEQLEWFIQRCRGEVEDIAVALPEMDTGFVLFGGFQGARGHSKIAPTARQTLDVTIVEDAYPRT